MNGKIVVHLDNGIPFSAKRNELSSQEKTQRDPQCIMLNETNPKKLYSVFPTIGHSRKGKTMEMVKRSVAAKDCRRGTEQVEHRGC